MDTLLLAFHQGIEWVKEYCLDTIFLTSCCYVLKYRYHKALCFTRSCSRCNDNSFSFPRQHGLPTLCLMFIGMTIQWETQFLVNGFVTKSIHKRRGKNFQIRSMFAKCLLATFPWENRLENRFGHQRFFF